MAVSYRKARGCGSIFFLSFEFRSRMLQAIIGMLFEEACDVWSRPSRPGP